MYLGKPASGSRDRTIRLWYKGAPRGTLDGHSRSVSAVAFHQTANNYTDNHVESKEFSAESRRARSWT